MNEPVIVWLRPDSGTSADTQGTIELLQTIIDDVKQFTDINKCMDTITDFKNKYVVLVISCTLDQETLAILCDLAVVSSIYIQCWTEHKHEEIWCRSFSKVKGVFTSMTQMISKINHEICLMEYRTIRVQVINALSDFKFSIAKRDKGECSFTYCLLLREVLTKFDSDDITDLIYYLRDVYWHDRCELTKINELQETYRMDRAIQWYTKDSFVHKLLNKSLRNHEIEILYFMRIFIGDLHQQILQLQSTSNQHERTTQTLYRGQRMPLNEFEQLYKNQGELLYVSQFLSTTEAKELAKVFAGACDENEAAVVFEIKLDQQERTNNVYAPVDTVSQFGDAEHEWLFSMGTVFHIEQIASVDNVWHVPLTLTSNKHRVLEEFLTNMRKSIQIEHPNPLIPLYRLLGRMGKYEEAIQLYEKNKDLHDHWEIRANVLDIQGLMHSDQHEEKEALSCYLQALDVVEKHADSNYPFLSSYHNNVAISYGRVDDPERSFEHYERVVELELQVASPDYLSVAYSYEAMADILFDSWKEHARALRCYERAHDCMLKVLPSNHPDICSIYEEIANVYLAQGLFDKAREALHKCLDLAQSSPDCIQHQAARIRERLAQIDQLEDGTFDDQEDISSDSPSSELDEKSLLNFIRAIARSSKDSSET